MKSYNFIAKEDGSYQVVVRGENSLREHTWWAFSEVVQFESIPPPNQPYEVDLSINNGLGSVKWTSQPNDFYSINILMNKSFMKAGEIDGNRSYYGFVAQRGNSYQAVVRGRNSLGKISKWTWSKTIDY